jgi:ethanolamine utilization protein EutQ (cupin superfamily)
VSTKIIENTVKEPMSTLTVSNTLDSMLMEIKRVSVLCIMEMGQCRMRALSRKVCLMGLEKLITKKESPSMAIGSKELIRLCSNLEKNSYAKIEFQFKNTTLQS